MGLSLQAAMPSFFYEYDTVRTFEVSDNLRVLIRNVYEGLFDDSVLGSIERWYRDNKNKISKITADSSTELVFSYNREVGNRVMFCQWRTRENMLAEWQFNFKPMGIEELTSVEKSKVNEAIRGMGVGTLVHSLRLDMAQAASNFNQSTETLIAAVLADNQAQMSIMQKFGWTAQQSTIACNLRSNYILFVKSFSPLLYNDND